MLVYRMEHKTDKCGPFVIGRPSEFKKEWGQYNNLCSHPLPQEDGIPNFQMGLDCCGVRSLDDILSWFGAGECLTYLKQDGYIIRVYDVDDDDVKIGRNQVAFPRCDDTPIVEEIEL